jgi:transcriptional regulator with XRE-family HTH domain
METEKINQRFWELLGEKLRACREDLKRSLDDVAEHSETSISKSSLSLMENGKQQVTVLQLFELSRMLDFSPSDILAEIEKELLSEKYSDINKII